MVTVVVVITVVAVAEVMVTAVVVERGGAPTPGWSSFVPDGAPTLYGAGR